MGASKAVKVSQGEGGPTFHYQLDGPPPSSDAAAAGAKPAKGKAAAAAAAAEAEAGKGSSGSDLADLIVALWQEFEFVSVDDVAASGDGEALKAIKKVTSFYSF